RHRRRKSLRQRIRATNTRRSNTLSASKNLHRKMEIVATLPQRPIGREALLQDGDSVPIPLGFIAFAPEWLRRVCTAHRIPGLDTALPSPPRVALTPVRAA